MAVRRAILQMLASRQLAILVMASGLAVLARLLTPTEFGVFAIGLAGFLVLDTLTRFGLESHLVRLPALDEDEARMAEGLMLTLSIVAMALVWSVLAVLPAGVFPDGLGAVFAVLAAALPLQALCLRPMVARRRAMRFGYLSVVGLSRVVADATVTIALAAAGAGALSLAFGVLADRALEAVLLRSPREAPPLRPRLAAPRRVVSFGLQVIVSDGLPRLADLALALAIGRFAGLDALGIFNRARVVVRLPDMALAQGVMPVILPAFSRELAEGAAPAALLGRVLSHLCVLCWPIFAMIALYADPLVATVLGAQWLAAVPVVRILALAGLTMPLTLLAGPFFVALDRTGTRARIQVVHQALMLSLAGLGALVSLELAAAGLVSAVAVEAGLIAYALRAHLRGAGPRLWRVARDGAVVSAAAVAGPLAVMAAWPGLPAPWLLLCGIALAAVGLVGGLSLARHPLLGELSAAFTKR